MKAGAKGFTLIELVVVITIIGILAAVAAPKFINVQTDARISVLSGVEASIRSGASLVYAKALIAGEESGAGAVDIDGDGADDINTTEGYPDEDQIGSAIDLSSNDVFEDAGNAGTFGFDSDGDGDYENGTDDQCEVVYTNNDDGTIGVVINSGGC